MMSTISYQHENNAEQAAKKKRPAPPISDVPEPSIGFDTIYSDSKMQVTNREVEISFVHPRKYMWLVTTLIDIVLWCVGFAVYMWCVLGTDDVSDRNSSRIFRFRVTIIFLSVDLAIILALSIILVVFRNEPEIRCHNSLFIGQVVVCTYMYLIIAIIRSTARSGTGVFAGIFSLQFELWGAVATVWTYFGLVSAFILRLRMIYRIFTTSRFQTQIYWLALHVVLLVISSLPIIVCTYGKYPCSTAQYYAGVWFMWIFFLLEGLYYLNAVRPVPGLFVDFWSNVRLVLFYFLTFAGMCFYTIKYGGDAPTVVTDMVILAANLILISWFELFGYRTIKVLAGYFKLPWFQYADLQGVSSYLLTNDLQGIAFIILDPFLYPKFETMAKEGFFYENLAFCRSWSAAKAHHDLAEKGRAVALIVTTYVTAVDDPYMQLNVSSKQRETIMKEYKVLQDTGVASVALVQTLDDVEQLILSMMQQHIGRFLNEKGVLEYCQRVIAMVKARMVVPAYTYT
ncbi:hypothetical protein SARC_11519 [Sphaeroforma arctica JP610]|uniref:RGS domain-containing protein n=1 Tax=Sphaeroforma arctica JP610 TaxID=667725 RepID=A0A0L0FGR2_9EUKA|nr:hypothetical protein SARC_11519 [Sphaeroforma arctica JP610]KNC75969.1 hypothetical protein SARC_11519 [Sphaeroforma arctica JP610]|eukprot:XP_014149871.1 hypothetical protein SARC_11519 [Sphaeroforma arctica JP610]